MKKVGILTLHYSLNYGGLLQTYATIQTLNSLGYEPEIIDRLPNSFRRYYPLVRTFVHPLTQRAFYKFRQKELQPISRPVRTSSELTRLLERGKYCAVVIGSDQVWRKEVFSVDGDYFMLHQKELPIKKIAYSASLGVGFWQYDETETQAIAEALSTFSGLACRESESVPLFKEKCGLDVQNILDPTLIANPQIYAPLQRKAKISGTGKLVTYILDWTETKQKIVDEVANSKGLTQQDILPQKNKRNNGLINRIIYQDPSVYDWVNQIATADFVVTDSFHGMAFSIIFGKQFVVIGNPQRGMARFTSLLRHLNLESRSTESRLPNIREDIDYEEVLERLNQYRKQGVNFLKECLKDVDE